MNCPSMEFFQRFFDDLLDKAEVVELESHLDECDACRDKYDTLMGDTEAVDFLDRSQTIDLPATACGALPDSAQQPVTRFQIQRFLAKGALGEVHIAHDSELHREVALKRMQPKYATLVDLRSRFYFEAEVTGGLEHPGIVPVYGCGAGPDGRPFYAMRLIRGESLKSAIQKLHDPADTEYSLRLLLNRFNAVCHAVAYAHSCGVVHRDLKPGNIMLGPFGETLAVDWGLAKRVEDDGDLQQGSQNQIASGHEISFGTMDGQVVGTPAYMSPEQAAGNVADVGVASDIFSLGVILFELVTGRRPYDGKTADILKKAALGEPPKATDLAPGCPHALGAICAKAMSKDPADRYANAMELAADIDLWLADEPIAVFRDSISVRLGRWMRRNRAAFAGLASLCFTSIIALSLGLWAVNQERIRTAKQRDAKRLALNTLTDDVIQRLMTRQVELSDDDRAFLHDVLDLYQQFAKEEGNSLDTQASVADGAYRVGQIRYRLDEFAAAEQSCQTAMDKYEMLAQAESKNHEHKRGLANCQRLMGFLHEHQGRLNQAQASYETARDLFRELVDSKHRLEEDLSELANCQTNLGVTFDKRNDLDAAKQNHAQARKTMQILLERSKPAKARYRSVLAEIENNLGILEHMTGNLDAAEALFRHACSVTKSLVEENRTSATNRHDYASSRTNLGAALQAVGKLEEAVAEQREAIALFSELQSEFPFKEDYRNGTASSSHNLGDVLSALNQPKEADEAYRVAIEVFTQLVQLSPSTPDYQFKLTNSLRARGELQLTMGGNQLADSLLQAANERFALIEEDYPLYLPLKHELLKATARNHLAHNEHLAAAKVADELAGMEFNAALDHFSAGQLLARCVSQILVDERISEAERSTQAEAVALKSVRYLQAAIENSLAGENVNELQQNTDFDSLRNRADFQKLLPIQPARQE